MTELEEQDLIPTQASKRPVFLLVLVILSALNIGISMMGAVGGMLGVKPDAELAKNSKLDFANMREQLIKAEASDYVYIVDQMESVTHNMFVHFQSYNSLQFLVLAFGLAGIALMYLGKKLGFHLYIIYTLGLLLMPYFFNDIKAIPAVLTIAGVLYGGIWVLLYSRNLYWLKD